MAENKLTGVPDAVPEPVGHGAPDAIPSAAVAPPKRRLSGVWVIPIIAALIGAWLTWKHITEKGPLITITFRSADGLEARKTKIKYRDLDIGVVETIELAQGLSHVVVSARMQPSVTPYLTAGTRFWVVRARLTAAGATGLSTLLSGAYIGVDPISEGPPQQSYEGLETPPLITSREAGKRFVLRSPSQGSLSVGVPVYFRQVSVGEIVRTELDPTGESVAVDVFIREPYDQRVCEGTRFWNTSGFDATVDKDGLHLETESVISMLIGGVAFDTPAGEASPVAPDGKEYALYPDKRSLAAPVYIVKQRFVAYFDGSVRGLTPGSPVEFRGIQIGQVAEVRLMYDDQRDNLRIPVIIEIEPERIGILGEQAWGVGDRLQRLVSRGLRARLESGNLLTGQLVVNLDLYPGEPAVAPRRDGPYPVLPTVPSQLDALTTSATHILRKLERLPLEKIGDETTLAMQSLRDTLETTKKLSESVQRDVVPVVVRTVVEAQRTLQATQKLVGPDSVLNVETRKLLNEMTDAARSMRLLADHLERHPEDLVRGRSTP